MSPTPQRLQITAANPDPALLDLPWQVPLEDWPAETLAALPRGISRHIVRFVRLSDGQRGYDLEVARVNIIGELMDLQAGEFLEEDVDAVAIGDALAERYGELWRALTESESFTFGDRWRVQARIDRLNDLGFDVGELDITTDVDGTSVRIQPKVVDAGHHSRRLMRLTGLDVQENQARRLLNDLDEFRAATDRQREDESFVAHDWLTDIFEPAVRSVPRDLRGKLEPAQIYHELLDHRWYLSEQQGHDVPMKQAAKSYVKNILPTRPDEQSILGVQAGEIPDTDTFPVVDPDQIIG